MRVVIDTNIWVSAFLNPHGYPARLVAHGYAQRFAVVASAPLLAELLEVLCRPRIMRVRDTTPADAERFVRAVSDIAQLVPITGNLHLCRDPDDDILLETAIVGKAAYLVSRDEDLTRDAVLLEQLVAHGVAIITVNRLLDRVGEATDG